MLKIGEFSILSTISIHMLRHYDEIGLLTPASVDEATGYRYYHENQLPAANQIIALKTMGFGLKEISHILKNRPEDAGMSQLLAKKAAEKENEIKRLACQLKQIKNSIGEIGNQNEYSGHIVIKEIPERLVISFRSKIREFSEEGLLWAKLNDVCLSRGIAVFCSEYPVAVLHEVNTEENYIDVEVQKTVEKELQKAAENPGESSFHQTDSELKTVKAVTVASLIFQGGYSRLKDVNAYAANWIADNGYEVSGALFNIYHISPGSEINENKFVTEVCIPVKMKSSPSWRVSPT